MFAALRSRSRTPRQRGRRWSSWSGVMLLGIALLAMIIDGGNVATHQRMTQTGSDSTAEAGAIVLATRLAGAAAPALGWDGEVAAKIAASAAANNIAVQAAYYTDICGIPLRSDGTAALNVDGTEDLASAMQVGTGGLPGGSATTPDCPSADGRARGGRHDHRAQRRPGVRGPSHRHCELPGQYPRDRGHRLPAGLLRLHAGQLVLGAARHDPRQHRHLRRKQRRRAGHGPWPWNTVLTVPLCKSNPGNVGWLDWDPPGGGASELVCSIVNPDNPAIALPSWQYVAATGNTNGGGPCDDDESGVDVQRRRGRHP